MILDEAMNYSRNNSHELSDDEEADQEDGDKPGGGRGAKRYVEKALNTGRGEGEGKSGTGIVALVGPFPTNFRKRLNLAYTFIPSGLHVRTRDFCYA